MIKSLRPLLKISLALLLFFQVKSFCHKRTEGFQLHKIAFTHAALPQWETDPPENAIASLLAQPFTYLGSGGQCYAFLSCDKTTVLKLFKMHHLREYPYLEQLPLPQRLATLIQGQRKKRENLFASCHLAYTSLKEESGLLYLQLNNTHQPLHVTLIDKIGISHSLALNNVPFALQSYAQNPFKQLRRHIQKSETAQARAIVEEIVNSLKARYAKGILDSDPSLRRNIGLIHHRARFIDIGAFELAAAPLSLEQQSALLQVETHRMNKWLAKRSPELKAHLDHLLSDQAE